MEPRRHDGGADRPRPAGDVTTGRVIVIGPYRRARRGEADSVSVRDPQARLDEAIGLARAIDLTVAESGLVSLDAVRPATYIGKGKVEEIAGLVVSHHADLVFRPEERRFILMDHNSTNGTYVNEVEIEPRRDLSTKDVIRIGSHRFLFMPLCHDGFFWDDEGALK